MQVIYSDIENEIVARLQPLTNGGGVDVVQLPQVQAEFERPFLVGRVTVAYKSSDYADVKSTHHIRQDEKLQLEIIIQARQLRGANGIHTIIEAVKRLLVGFRPTDCSKMYLVKNGFTAHDNEAAIWNYSMIFETVYVLVEDAEEETGPLLEELEFIYNEEDGYPVTPPLCEPVVISNTNGLVLSTQNAGVPFVVPNTDVTVKDQDGNELASESLPSGEPGEIELNIPAPADGTVEVRNSNNDLVDSGTVASGGFETFDAPDGTVEVRKSDNTLIQSVTVPSSGVVPYPVADSVITLNNSAGATLQTENVKATDPATLIAPDGTAINTDGTFTLPVTSGGSATIPDSQINVNGVNEGDVVSVQPINLTLTDGTNPVTPESVTVVGNDVEVKLLIPTDEWKRDKNWFLIPQLSPSDNRFVGLILIFEDSFNQNALQISGNGLDVNLDWGDGTIVTGAGTFTHIYDYTTITSPVNVYKDGRNYKQVIVDITVNSGTVISFFHSFGITHNQFGTINYVDIEVAFPDMENFRLSGTSFLMNMRLCERLVVYANNVIGGNVLMNNMSSLRFLDVNFDGSTGVFGINQIGPCDAKPLNIDFGTRTNINSIFATSNLIRKLGNITANNVTVNSSNIFLNSVSLEEVGHVTLLQATTAFRMFRNCISLERTGTITMPYNTSIQEMYLDCWRIREVVLMDCENVQNTTNAFFRAGNIEKLILKGITVGFDISGCNLKEQALIDLANNAGDANGSQTVITTGNPGASATSYILIFNSKGFIVVN